MTSETIISTRTARSRWVWRHVLLIGLLLGGAIPSELSPVKSCFGASRPKLTARETAQLAAANALAKKLRRESKIPEAIAALGKVYQITAMFYGKDHWRTTDARLAVADFRKRAALTPAQRKQLVETRRMREKVVQLYKQGKLSEALKIEIGVPPILTKILGPQHPETLASINNLGMLYLRMGQHAKALTIFQKNLNDKEKVFGRRHPSTTSNLSKLASTYRAMGQYAKALSLFQEELENSISNHGPQHLKTLAILRSVAGTYQAMGDYAKALPLIQRSLDDTRKALGTMHPETAARLRDLAFMHETMGNYAKALPLYQQSVDISKKTLGPQHPELADRLSRLAKIHDLMGQYSKALPLCRQSLKISRETLGPQHPKTAIHCASLATLYQRLGDNAKALPLYTKSLEINRKNYGPKHTTAAIALGNLAVLYQQMGDYAKALTLYEQSLEIEREVRGQRHPRVAQTLSNMASLYYRMGDYAKALPLIQESLRINKKALGPQHSDTAGSFGLLGVIHRDMGDYDKAMPLLQQSLEIESKVLGPRHPHTVAALGCLVTLYHWMGEYDKAEPLAREAVAISCRNLEVASAIQSEQPELVMSKSLCPRLDAYVYLALNSKRHAESALSNVLAWRRAGLMRQRAARFLAQRPDLEILFKRRQAIALHLAKLAKVAPKPDQRKAMQLHRAKMSERLEQIHADLAAKSASFRQSQRKVTADALRRVLPKNTALIYLQEYKSILPPKGGKKRSLWRLAAFVVHPKRPIVLIDLGDYQYLGTAVQRWRSGFGRTRDSRSAGVLLRKQIWDPLEPHIKGAKIVLVSPNGVFGALPLATLPGKKPGSYLLEDWAICVAPTPLLMLESPRDSKSKPKRPAGGMLLVGDVDYNASQTGNVKKPAIRLGGRRRYSPLPGSKSEIIAIEKIYRSHHKNEVVTRLTAANATEKRFRYTAHHRTYLHVVTHMYFTPFRIRIGSLSGLAMAGANHSDPKKDEGVVTTEEIGLMDLSRTDLVVLSACDTSRDMVGSGKGLLGLQHAFQIAGARSTLASMWKAPNSVTMLLMERFYSNMWDKRMGKLEALREAQLWMLREGRAHLKKSTGKNTKTTKSTRLSPFF